MIFRRAAADPAAKKKRLSPAFLASVVVHTGVAIALMRILVVPGGFSETKGKRPDVIAERIGFLSLPRAGDAAPTAGRSGGDGRPDRDKREITVVAPVAIPTSVPAPGPVAAVKPEEGSGPLVGTGGPARGIRPAYSDPRVWAPPAKIVYAPKSVKETIDSVIAVAIGPTRDSLVARAAREKRDPTDWTIEKGGYKWGIDRQQIRLGPVSIPTALLAMLPLNVQGNPQVMERDRAYAYMSRDIALNAQKGINEADFKKAVRSIRERKERERAAALGTAPAAKDQSLGQGGVPPRS